MTLRLTDITGREAQSGRGDALDAFSSFTKPSTRAISMDLRPIGSGRRTSMDNPMGGIRRGWQSISEGYLKLFGGPAIVQVTFHDFTSQGGDDWLCSSVVKKARVLPSRRRWTFDFVRRAGLPGVAVPGVSCTTMARSKSPGCSPRTRRQFSERRWARWYDLLLPNFSPSAPGAGMSLFSRRQVLQTTAGAATALASGYPARADEYPSRPIRLVIPYAAGGSGDQIGRPWADRMASLLGPTYVENIGGAGGALGCSAVAQSAPDGYSLLLGNGSTKVIIPLTSANPPYDTVRDFRPSIG